MSKDKGPEVTEDQRKAMLKLAATAAAADLELTPEEAVERLWRAVERQGLDVLDSLGLRITGLTEVYRAYARYHGIKPGELSNMDKQRAYIEAVLKANKDRDE